MLRLAREHDVPSLPVHDSLIVPLSQVELSQAGFLKEQFQSRTGVIATLKVKRSTGRSCYSIQQPPSPFPWSPGGGNPQVLRRIGKVVTGITTKSSSYAPPLHNVERF